jgi:hypothetical protein
MDVGDVLRDRMQEPAGLQRMVAVSLAVHMLALAAAIFTPGGWFSPSESAARPVMTITLGGGTPGPQNGGMTNIGGRPVQAEAPEAPKRPEPVRPPAAATPEMTLPKPGAKPSRAATTAPVKEAPRDARGKTPIRGPQSAEGSTVAETGVRGQGFGLSTGGGGGGTGLKLDVGDFCCPDYLLTMTERIHANWNRPSSSRFSGTERSGTSNWKRQAATRRSISALSAPWRSPTSCRRCRRPMLIRR